MNARMARRFLRLCTMPPRARGVSRSAGPIGFVVLAVLLAGVTPRVDPAIAAPPIDLKLDAVDLADHRGRVWTLADLLAADRPDASETAAANADPKLTGQGEPAASEVEPIRMETPAKALVVAFLGT